MNISIYFIFHLIREATEKNVYNEN